MPATRFEWDDTKDRENRAKHGPGFAEVQYAFADPHRVIAIDAARSGVEKRYFCFGCISGYVLTVRSTYRSGLIRIFGAGYWRKGKQIYDRENQVRMSRWATRKWCPTFFQPRRILSFARRV